MAGALITSDTGRYTGAYYYADRLQYAIENPDTQRHYDKINSRFSNTSNVSIVGYSADGNKGIVMVSSTNNIGSYYVYDFASGALEGIVDKEPKLTDQLNSSADILKIATGDGSSITAYHHYPKGKKHSKLPLIVMPHGGPEARDYFDYGIWTQYFVSSGYQVVQMNFRGSSGYGRAFAEAGHGEWGGVMQDDITDTVKYFHSQNLATPEKTCIVGYSYGGYAALYGGATTPELYSCVVSGGGVSDLLRSLKSDKKDYGKDSDVYEYWLKSMGDPKIDKEMLQSRSPVNLVSGFDDPVFLVHGEYDGIVDIEQSERMHKALKKAGKSVEYMVLDGEGHSNWSLEGDIQYLESVMAFVHRHIGN